MIVFHILQIRNQHLRQEKIQRKFELAKAKFGYSGSNRIFFLTECECNQTILFSN